MYGRTHTERDTKCIVASEVRPENPVENEDVQSASKCDSKWRK